MFEFPSSLYSNVILTENNQTNVQLTTLKLMNCLAIVNGKTQDKEYRYTVDICKQIFEKLSQLQGKVYNSFVLLRFVETLFYLKNHTVLLFIDHNYCAYIIINGHNTGICINREHLISIDPDKVN